MSKTVPSPSQCVYRETRCKGIIRGAEPLALKAGTGAGTALGWDRNVDLIAELIVVPATAKYINSCCCPEVLTDNLHWVGLDNDHVSMACTLGLIFRMSIYLEVNAPLITKLKMTFTDSDAMALGIILEGVLHGVYTILIALYLILWRRNSHAVGGLLALAQVLLFSLCTLCFCLDIATAYFSVVPDVANEDTAHTIGIGALVVSAITDYLAQMILVSATYTFIIATHQAAKLYRYWVIWSRQWVVVAIPGFLALVSLGGGLAFAVFSHSPLWSTSPENIFPLYQSMGVATTSISLAVNALATSIIMTKILLTSPEVRPALGSDLRWSFHIVAAMLIESGFLVLAFQFVFVVLFSIQHPAAIMIALPIIQIYGITPTLLNIHIVMGSAGDRTTTKSLSLRFAHPGGATTRTTGRSMSAVQAQSINIEPDNVSNNEGGADSAIQYK